MSYLKRFWIGLVLFFGLQSSEEAVSVPVVENITPQPKIVRPKAKTEGAVYNEFYFRESILDQLDEYFSVVRRMRRYDPEAYELYSKLGAHIVPFASGVTIDKVSPWWLKTRPSFGAVGFVGQGDAEEKWTPTFLYFQKYDACKAPAQIQRCRTGDVYIVTVYWDHYKDGEGGIPVQFPILVSNNGTISLLKTKLSTSRKMRSKRGKEREYSIPHKHWGIHNFYKEWAREKSLSVEEHLLSIFKLTTNFFEAGNSSMIRVDARKEGLHAVFGVSVTRTPYFFKDRAVRLGLTGRRKRIFHIVKTHQRKNGSIIKMHFRGERQFEWNGYSIGITVPGYDHPSVAEFEGAARDIGDEEIETGMMTTGEMANKLRKIIDERPWTVH